MALFVRAAFTVIIVRMECGFPFLFSFNPFKIHLQTRKDLGHRLFDLVDFAFQPRVENGIEREIAKEEIVTRT